MGSKKLFVIQNGTVIHTIPLKVPCLVSRRHMMKTYGYHVQIRQVLIKLIPLDYTVESHALDVSIGAGWGVAPAFSAKDDIVYFSNAGFNLYRHIFSQNKTEKVANIKDYVEDAGTYYNS